MWFLFGKVSSSSVCLGWATFIVALPEPSINYFAWMADKANGSVVLWQLKVSFLWESRN